ncbi:MAG: HAD family hydrolase [Bacteroidetes bacterium]|nr:HAD family hydrolase [Bacteroidota bacterium]
MAELFFDLDRTLWHHERNHEQFFEELHAAQSWPGLALNWAKAYLRINDRLWDHIQAHNLSVEYVRARRFPLLFREMGLAFSNARVAKELASQCEGVLKERLPDFGEGYEGVHEAFATLVDRGHRLHILTNGVLAPQQRKIAALGLTEHIDVFMTSDVAKSYKPAPDIFRAALVAAGAQAESSWMIGDSVLRDVLGGQGVGMRTAWFRAPDALPPDAEGRADFEFSDWKGFPEQLKAAMDRS